MFEYSVLATHIVEVPKNYNHVDKDVLDSPEWAGFLPLVEFAAWWSTANRKRALSNRAKDAKHAKTFAQDLAVKPSCP
jgi:hypothetical protein